MSHVYFVQAGENGPVKIGLAEDPDRRVAELQTGCFAELRLLGTIAGDRGTERALHERFADYRIRGEWFEPSAAVFEAFEVPSEEGGIFWPPWVRADAFKRRDRRRELQTSVPCPWCGVHALLGNEDVAADPFRVDFYCRNSDCKTRTFCVLATTTEYTYHAKHRADIRALRAVDAGTSEERAAEGWQGSGELKFLSVVDAPSFVESQRRRLRRRFGDHDPMRP